MKFKIGKATLLTKGGFFYFILFIGFFKFIFKFGLSTLPRWGNEHEVRYTPGKVRAGGYFSRETFQK